MKTPELHFNCAGYTSQRLAISGQAAASLLQKAFMAISERLFVPRVSLFSRFINHLLKISFHLLYHQLAWVYDWIAALVSCGLWNTWVVQALPYLEGPLVLELGPGPGHMQAALRRMGVHVRV